MPSAAAVTRLTPTAAAVLFTRAVPAAAAVAAVLPAEDKKLYKCGRRRSI